MRRRFRSPFCQSDDRRKFIAKSGRICGAAAGTETGVYKVWKTRENLPLQGYRGISPEPRPGTKSVVATLCVVNSGGKIAKSRLASARCEGDFGQRFGKVVTAANSLQNQGGFAAVAAKSFEFCKLCENSKTQKFTKVYKTQNFWPRPPQILPDFAMNLRRSSL